MRIFKSKSAQSTLEYAIIIAVVVAGLLAMQIYINRGVQGKLRESTDKIGNQYVPGSTTSKYTTAQNAAMTTTERFGLDDSDTHATGVSKYNIDTAASVTHSATGADSEKVNDALSAETKLLP